MKKSKNIDDHLVFAALVVGEKKDDLYNNHLFAALVIDKKKDDFYVYLANDSDKHYKAVKVLTGAYVWTDENLVVTSKVIRDRGKFSVRSVMKIDEGDLEEVLYGTWYWVDLVDDCGKISQYTFRLPDLEEEYIEEVEAIFGKTGLPIDLEERDGESIAEKAKTMGMGTRYYKMSSGEIP